MSSASQLQKRLDSVFQNGAVFTQTLDPGSVTFIASRGWALREHGDSVLVAIVFATIPRRWIHLVSKAQDEANGLDLFTPRGRRVSLRPLNTKFVRSDILHKIKSDLRTAEDLDAEIEAFLEVNPHISLDRF